MNETTATLSTAMLKVSDQFHDAFKRVAEVAKAGWSQILGLAQSLNSANNEIELRDDLRTTWYTPMDTTRQHQVLNRKPEYITIRNRLGT